MTKPELKLTTERDAPLVWGGEGPGHVVALWLADGKCELVDNLALLQKDGSEHDILLVCEDPVIELTRKLEAGTIPSVALADWEVRAREILSLLQSNRTRTKIVTPQYVVEQVGMGLPGLVPEHMPTVGYPEETDPVLRMLARTVLISTSAVLALAEEIEAATIGRQSGSIYSSADTPDAIFTSYRTAREAEHDAVHNELAAKLAQAEEAYIEVAAYKGRAEQLLGDVSAHLRDLEASEAMRADIEGYAANLENAHLRTLQSTSWRMTAPLRAVIRRARGLPSPDPFRARFQEHI